MSRTSTRLQVPVAGLVALSLSVPRRCHASVSRLPTASLCRALHQLVPKPGAHLLNRLDVPQRPGEEERRETAAEGNGATVVPDVGPATPLPCPHPRVATPSVGCRRLAPNEQTLAERRASLPGLTHGPASAHGSSVPRLRACSALTKRAVVLRATGRPSGKDPRGPARNSGPRSIARGAGCSRQRPSEPASGPLPGQALGSDPSPS